MHPTTETEGGPVDFLFVEYNKDGNGQIWTTVNSFLALYIFDFVKKPEKIQIIYLQREINRKDAVPVKTVIPELPSCHYPDNVNDLKLPVYQRDQKIFIAGMCAVCREIVKAAVGFVDLLGFKQSSLLAPAETSIWTRFCELEVPRDLLGIMEQSECLEEYTIPEVFRRFEGHLKLPVRMHNIYKLAREKANHNQPRVKGKGKVQIDCSTPKENLPIEHTFSEGIEFTIADLILYPQFKLTTLILPEGFNFTEEFPTIRKWLQSVDQHSPFCMDLLKEMVCIATLSHKTLKVQSFNVLEPEKRETNNRESHSLYKSDPKRYQPRARTFTNQADVEERIEKLRPLNLSFTVDGSQDYGDMDEFDWSSIDSDHLEKSVLPAKRLERKRQQLTNLANAVVSLVGSRRLKVVDFCSGTGPLGLLLAKKLPNCSVVILENKAISLELARKRSEELNLENCIFYQCNLDYFLGKFDVGCSLHACGTATDIVIDKCLRARASFVSCPCCYGSIQPMPHIPYPQSSILKTVLVQKDFLFLAHAADQAHQEGTQNCRPETIEQGRKCMTIVDTDRKIRAEELGYKVILTKLQPECCTPKNHLLVGQIF